MANRFVNNVVYGNTHCAIEHAEDDSQEVLYALLAKVKQGELKITATQEFYLFDKLEQFAKPNQHVHLVINNRHVLRKELEYANIPNESLVNLAFPNIKIEDFYFEIVKVSEKIHVQICRKAYVQGLISTYESLKLNVLSWSLGVASIQVISNLLEQVVEVNGATIVPGKDAIKAISYHPPSGKGEEIYDLSGLNTTGKYLLGLAAVIQSFTGQVRSNGYNFNKDIQDQKHNFKQKVFFRKGLIAGIGFLLLTFLINFTFFNYYYEKVNELTELNAVNEMQKLNLIKTDSIVRQKQKLFEDVINSTSSTASLFVDQIVEFLPENIGLNSLNYQPLTRRILEKKEILLDKNKIIIAGETRSSDSLSAWITDLEQLEYVNGVTILSLLAKSGVNNFELELNISDHQN